MKRRPREISVFSTSAIDLFASAMGAFIIIALVLIVNKSPTPVPVIDPTPLQQKIEQLQQALQEAQQAQSAAEAAAAAAHEATAAAQAAATAAADAQADAEARAAAAEALASNRPTAILGIVTQAKSFVVVLDMSGSMKEYETITRQTLDETLDAMDDKKKVQILGYQATTSGVDIPSWKPARQLATMSAPDISSAKSFVGTLISRFGGNTPTRAALLEALQYDAAAILLFSDGAPTDAPGDNPMTIVEEVTRLNAGKKEIHTIAIGRFSESRDYTLFLSKLADANRGKFLGIDKP